MLTVRKVVDIGGNVMDGPIADVVGDGCIGISGAVCLSDQTNLTAFK
jgi:hypothetical protein